MRRKVKHLAFFFAACLLALIGCSAERPRITASINPNASLTGELPANPLQWKIITSALNITDSTMSTLYGNDVAVHYARTHTQHDYPAGSTLSLVTWAQMDDARWFGGKIPGRVQSVEFVFVKAADDGRTAYSYEQYEGAPLKMRTEQQGFTPNDRAAYLLAQRAAVLP